MSRIEKALYSRIGCLRNKLTLPDFMIIGAQKSGTSWLHNNLIHHPGVYFPDLDDTFSKLNKHEIHFFNREFNKSLKYYSSKFEKGINMVKGDITPAYSILPLSRIKFIRTIMPEVKLIFIMRNPIERAWSHAIMEIVKLQGKTYEDVPENRFYKHFQTDRSLLRGDYTTILHNWLEVFPKDQMYIGFFEDISDNPKQLLKDIFGHIGLSLDVHWDDFPYNKKINKNPSISIPDKYRVFLEELYFDKIEALYERFGKRVDLWRCQR